MNVFAENDDREEGVTGNIKILLVHDKHQESCSFCNILKRHDYRIYSARGSEQALMIYLQEKPDLVIIDTCLENENGYSVAKRLKNASNDAFVPLIYITPVKSNEVVGMCLENHGVDVIYPPFDETTIKSKVTTYTSLSYLSKMEKHQRDILDKYNETLRSNYEVAENVFRKVMYSNVLEMPAVKYSLSPIAIFNGDIMLAAFRPTGELHVFLGDFTGHGLTAAIGAIPVSDIFYGMTAKGFGVSEIVNEINTKLKRILPLGLFLTACMFEFDPEFKKLSVWNGGMPDALIFNKSSRTVTQRFPSKNYPLGIDDTISTLETVDAYLVRDEDVILMFTDGVTETMNPAGKMYGIDMLITDLAGAREASLIDRITQSVVNFADGQIPLDDRTLLQIDLNSLGKNIDAKRIDHYPPPLQDSNWQVIYIFGPEILRQCDPLPVVMQGLMETQKLYRYKQDIFIILKELFTNALDHGLLRLKSGIKQDTGGFSEYLAEKQHRLQNLTDGSITVDIAHTGTPTGGRVTICISDSGSGFDVIKLEKAIADDSDYYGRGIKLVKSICDQVDYSAIGNQVCAVYCWSA